MPQFLFAVCPRTDNHLSVANQYEYMLFFKVLNSFLVKNV